ncbi:MAG: acetyl-CoA C-acyltransferase [Myxococcales bacterium]|nr:acetyl-CoA C-acyltransferase [Myxococcales bacterium]
MATPKTPRPAAATLPGTEPTAPPAAAGVHIRIGGADRIAIVAGVRSPFSRSFDVLNDVDPVELSTQVARELLFRLEIPMQDVDQIVWGTVVAVPRSPNIAREVALNLGMWHASGFSVSRACASGIQAVATAAEMIASGQCEVIVAGGVDVVSHAPVTYKKRLVDQLQRLQRAKGLALVRELSSVNPLDLLPTPPALTERFTGLTMGEHAEQMAQNFGITRAAQEEFAIGSHRKAHAATQAGLLRDEIVTIQTPRGPVAADNLIRADMDPDKLAKLKPVFDRRNGTITAATSSALTDGAAACLVMRASKAKALGLPVLGFVRSFAFAGQDPRENMLLGNVYSTPVALQRAGGLGLADLDRVEIHEAFAAQVLSNLKMFASEKFFAEKLGGRHAPLGELDPAKLNVRGGSLAFGHPFAATGIRMITGLLRTLQADDGNLGLATACAAGGMGGAIVVERN